jgi:hypothetical protein
MREGARGGALFSNGQSGLGVRGMGEAASACSYVTAAPIKRKSALGDCLLSLGIAPLRESPESPMVRRLRCPVWVISGRFEMSNPHPLFPPKADIAKHT